MGQEVIMVGRHHMKDTWWLVVDAASAGIAERLAPAAALIAERLGQPVSLMPAEDPIAVMAASTEERMLGWFAFKRVLDGLAQGAARPIAMVQYKGDPYYRSMIVGRAGIAARAWPQDGRGKRLWVGAQAALGGWIAPAAALRAQGIDPRAYFDVAQAANLDEGVLSVLIGKGDYAVTYNRALRNLIDEGKVKAGDFCIAWASEPLPYDAITVLTRLDKGPLEQVRAALLSIGSPQDAARLPSHYTGFSYAQDADYDCVRRMVRAVS